MSCLDLACLTCINPKFPNSYDCLDLMLHDVVTLGSQFSTSTCVKITILAANQNHNATTTTSKITFAQSRTFNTGCAYLLLNKQFCKEISSSRVSETCSLQSFTFHNNLPLVIVYYRKQRKHITDASEWHFDSPRCKPSSLRVNNEQLLLAARNLGW